MDQKCRNKQERKNSLAVSVACIAIYWPIPGFKGRTFKLCVLTRWDFNFCVPSSPLRGQFMARWVDLLSQQRAVNDIHHDYIVFQECHLYNLGGATFKTSLRAAGATLLSPRLQGAYNVTGSNKMGHNKAAFNKLTHVHRVLHGKDLSVY